MDSDSLTTTHQEVLLKLYLQKLEIMEVKKTRIAFMT